MDSAFKKVKRIPKVILPLDCIQVILENMTCFKSAINLARTNKKIWERFKTYNLFYKKWTSLIKISDMVTFLVEQYGCLCCFKIYLYNTGLGQDKKTCKVVGLKSSCITGNLDIFKFCVERLLYPRYSFGFVSNSHYNKGYLKNILRLICCHEHMHLIECLFSLQLINPFIVMKVAVSNGNIKALKYLLLNTTYTTEEIEWLKNTAEKHNQKEIANYLK